MRSLHTLAHHAQQEQPQHAAAEDRRQLPPRIQDAVYAHHQQAHYDAERSDDERRSVERRHAPFFREFFLRQPFREVGQHDGRRRVDARRYGAHSRREERRHHQSRQPRRQSVYDEPRENLVRRHAFRQQFGLRHVVAEQRRSDVYEHQRHRNVEQAAEQRRFHGFGRRLGGHVALYVVLIDAIVLHVHKKAIDQHHPERRFGQRQREAAQAEFPVRRRDVEQLPGAFGHRERQYRRTCYRSEYQYDALYRIRPHDGRYAAQQRVDQGRYSRADYDRLNVPPEHRVQRQGQQQQNRADAGQLRQQVAHRHIAARPVAEAEFQVVVGRYAVHVAVKRNEDLRRQPRGDGYRQAEYERIPVAFIGIARQPQEADDAHHPRGQRAFRRSECRGPFAAAEIEAAPEEGHAAYKDEKYQIVK